MDEPKLNKLRPFTSPPLIESFMKFYGMTEDEAGAGYTAHTPQEIAELTTSK